MDRFLPWPPVGGGELSAATHDRSGEENCGIVQCDGVCQAFAAVPPLVPLISSLSHAIR